MLPLVVEYLRSHTFAQLKADHGVDSRLSNDRRKASLNYDSITAKPGDQLSGECRGMVVRIPDVYQDGEVVDEVRVLARPMDRFYNYGDPAGADVDFNDRELAILEKLDGTMCELYHDDVQWCVATRSVPDADLPIKKDHVVIGDMTFAGLFWNALEHVLRDHGGLAGQMFIDRLDRDVTYVFELTSPYNRVIVAYPESRVTLLTARNRITGVEFIPSIVDLVDAPRRYDAQSIESIVEFINDQDPTMLEGVVLVDSKHRRIKVKSFNWCFASKTKFELTATRRNMLKLILGGHLDDIAPNLDAEIIEALNVMKDKVVAYAVELDHDYASLRARVGDNRKDFALLVKASVTWHSAMFALYTCKATSALEWIQQNMKGKANKPFAEAILRAIDRR